MKRVIGFIMGFYLIIGAMIGWNLFKNKNTLKPSNPKQGDHFIIDTLSYKSESNSTQLQIVYMIYK
jgi:predicted negative regulator of RcsB-dependent stress response